MYIRSRKDFSQPVKRFSGNTVTHLYQTTPHTACEDIVLLWESCMCKLPPFPMGYSPGEKRCPSKMADMEETPPPSSRKAHPEKKPSKGSRRPAQVSKELQAELRHNKGGYKQQKQGQVTHKEYRAAV